MNTIHSGPRGTPSESRAVQLVEDVVLDALGNPVDARLFSTSEEGEVKLDVGNLFKDSLGSILKTPGFVQIPLSWFDHIQRGYRKQKRPDIEAIHILAYVISRYRRGGLNNEILYPASR